MKAFFLLSVQLLLLLAFYLPQPAWAVQTLTAVIRGTEGNEDIFGLAVLTEADDGAVTVQAEILGLPDGSHGIHIHQYGDLVGMTDGTATGGHWNPLGEDHAGPTDLPRHVGDLGNIFSANAAASLEFNFAADDDARPTVTSILANSALGRALVVHADEDDLVSQPTGNAGARLAAGVFGIGNDALNSNEQVVIAEDDPDFEQPSTLVCKIVGELGIDGFAKVLLVNGTAELSAFVSGLTPNGQHGFHIHTYGEEYDFSLNVTLDSVRDLDRTGGHYNPTDAMHGLPDDTPRHYGDAGNLVAGVNGTATKIVALAGVTDLRTLVGRTCLVHADPDDGTTQPTGNAGARIAGGQLGYANPDTNAAFPVPSPTPAPAAAPVASSPVASSPVADSPSGPAATPVSVPTADSEESGVVSILPKSQWASMTSMIWTVAFLLVL